MPRACHEQKRLRQRQAAGDVVPFAQPRMRSTEIDDGARMILPVLGVQEPPPPVGPLTELETPVAVIPT